jgi:hypothetical protein
VQTQVFGVSSGGTVRDMNCERLKLSKTLYDMGMKVAAVATMCQDRRVFDAMLAAGTPCEAARKVALSGESSIISCSIIGTDLLIKLENDGMQAKARAGEPETPQN